MKLMRLSSPETKTNNRAASEFFIRHTLPDHEPPFRLYGGFLYALYHQRAIYSTSEWT